MSKEPNVQEQLPVNETENEAPVLKYTDEQMREIYNEGQKSGYIAAIKQIRSNITDYLNDLIIAANQNKGE